MVLQYRGPFSAYEGVHGVVLLTSLINILYRLIRFYHCAEAKRFTLHIEIASISLVWYGHT